jgi:hypothetical protein
MIKQGYDVSNALVPVKEHYLILKEAERAIQEELNHLDQGWLLVGTRVAYYVSGPDDAPEGDEYKLDCGFLNPLDQILVQNDDATTDEWCEAMEEDWTGSLLPVTFMNRLYQSIASELQRIADSALFCFVGAVYMNAGSTQAVASGCYCWGPRRRREVYAGITRCVPGC